jgi:hypothetical protein
MRGDAFALCLAAVVPCAAPVMVKAQPVPPATAASSCDAEKQAYADRLGVPCSALGGRVDVDGATTMPSLKVGVDAGPTQQTPTSNLTFALNTNLMATAGGELHALNDGKCDVFLRLWGPNKSLIASVRGARVNPTHVEVNIRTGERVFLLGQAYAWPTTCAAQKSFVPEPGRHYTATITYTNYFPLRLSCGFAIIDDETGLPPASVEPGQACRITN